VNKSVELVVAQRANLDWRDIYGDLTLTVGNNNYQQLIFNDENITWLITEKSYQI
jgi:hypothetical protein